MTGCRTGATGPAPDLTFYNSAVWEDETHVLFTLFQDGKWSIVRMGVDGADGVRRRAAAGRRDGSPLALRDTLTHPAHPIRLRR